MCAVGGVVTAVVPFGGLKKYVAFAVSLAFCCTLLSFLPGADSGNGAFEIPQVNIEDASDEVRQEIIVQTVNKICESVKADVMSKYSVNGGEITVSLDYTDGEEVTVNGFYIELCGGRNMAKLTNIQYYVTEKYGAECTAVYIER